MGAGNRSAIGTLVERTTRYCLLLHLPAGHDPATVAAAMTATVSTLPAMLRRSRTWDQGKEMTHHAAITLATGLQIYFCDPHSPWQRGSNENTYWWRMSGAGILRREMPRWGRWVTRRTRAENAFR